MCPWDSEGLIFSIDVPSAVSVLRIFVNPQLGHAASWFLAPHFGQISCAIALLSSERLSVYPSCAPH